MVRITLWPVSCQRQHCFQFNGRLGGPQQWSASFAATRTMDSTRKVRDNERKRNKERIKIRERNGNTIEIKFRMQAHRLILKKKRKKNEI